MQTRQNMQSRTPKVLSRIFVVKYQRHSSDVLSLQVSAIEIVKLMKCANSCDISCFEVSNIHIFQGLGGFSKHRFRIKTEKESTPKLTWIRTPTNPTILQLLFSSSSIFKPYYKVTQTNLVIEKLHKSIYFQKSSVNSS